ENRENQGRIDDVSGGVDEDDRKEQRFERGIENDGKNAGQCSDDRTDVGKDVGDSRDDGEDKSIGSAYRGQADPGDDPDQSRFDDLSSDVVGDGFQNLGADDEGGFKEAVGNEGDDAFSKLPSVLEHREAEDRDDEHPREEV